LIHEFLDRLKKNAGVVRTILILLVAPSSPYCTSV